MMELQIAAMPIGDQIPKDKSLTERLQFAMRYVREYERNLFWMSAHVDDDMKFRTAIAAVMLTGNEDDKQAITDSMKPLRMLSAAMQGIPVDFSQLPSGDDLIPLMKLWRESETTTEA